MSEPLRIPTPLLAPSILSADFARLADGLKVMEAGEPCVVHVDVMDGHFVPNITIGMPVVAALRKETKLTLDCHLMIENPGRYALEFIQAGADWVSVHLEADPHIHRTLSAIRGAGAKAGVVLNPGTPVEGLVDLVGDFDFVLLMSVNPGFGGQSFIPRILDKVARLDTLRRERNIPFMIQVDGGVGMGNARELVQAGADVLVAGNAVFKAPDPVKAIAELQAKMSAR
ncbi:ribulose-phosphate 3-epimerase [Holophaga foetida]|uniref:ribulose-phosphate 3-epimerase n=1 Tax=Holophaga foetida TaxID=35839 RepID=UPI000247337A|nr:ribulose-phosphate 3-epimerase [Holophaga foetida]